MFLKEFNAGSCMIEGNVWIIKPGEDTNRGAGIHVSNDLAEIHQLIN